MAKKRGSRKTKPRVSKSSLLKNRIVLAWKNLLLFLVLFILSAIMYGLSSNGLLKNFFAMLSIILGILAVAFLISWIVLLLSKRR